MLLYRWLALSLLVLPVSAHANADELIFRVLGLRSQVLYQVQPGAQPGTVGQLTDRTLRAAISRRELSEYRGDEGGVSSINRLGSAEEILSPTEYKAYGWCYAVDGVEPAAMADEYVLSGRERLVEWWYAYAHYRDGRWIAMCEPADHEAR